VPENVELEILETQARKAERRLWANPQPVQRWEWRKK
jgi:hypothetical protein